MIITDSSLRAIDKGFQKTFLGAIANTKTVYGKLAMMTTSSQAAEVYGDIGFIPSMRKMIGEAFVKNLKEVAHTIANDEFESTIAVRQADIERDSLGIYGPKIAMLGSAGEKLKDKLVVDLLVNGFTATDYTGQTFFNTAHKHFAGGKVTFNNKGTKKLSATNFEVGRAAIRGFKDENNEPMGLGDQLALVVSPAYEGTARRIVEAEFANGGDTNVNRGSAEVVVSGRLAAAEDNWFILDIGQPVRALILQEEKALQLLSTATGLTTEQLLTTHKYLWQAYWRGNAGYGLPQLAYGSTGADAA